MSSITDTPPDLVALALSLRTPSVDVAGRRERLRVIGRMRNMLDGEEAETLRELDQLNTFPAALVAEEQRTSLSAGQRLCDRAATAAAMPELSAALDSGDLSGRKIDMVTSQLRGLSAEQLDEVAAQADRIVRAGASLSDREFGSVMKRIVDHVRDDGVERFEQQRRDMRFGLRTNAATGMVVPYGQFDPEFAAILTGAISAECERLFHGGQIPAGAPTDHLARQEHLDALALKSLVTGGQRGGGDAWGPGPDVSVIVDAQTLLEGTHEGSVLEVSAGGTLFDLPVEVIRRWLDSADITPVVVAPGGQRLMMGRTIRTASRAQRRALRNLYSTCALCETSFDHCHVHHVDWWEHGGTTDIDRLLPVCTRHHAYVHHEGWQLHLAPDRTLTVTLLDGTVRVHSPPRVRSG